MSNASIRNSQLSEPVDQPLPEDLQAAMSSRLSEIALILSAGEPVEGATLESIRRLGCHLCRKLGHPECTPESIAANENDCPLDADDPDVAIEALGR